MLKRFCVLVCFLGYFVLGSNAGAVSFIKPCKSDDVKCITASSQAAIPQFMKGIGELGLLPAEPLHIDSVNADASNLKLSFHNIDVVGPSKAKVVEVSRDVSKQTIKMVLETPLAGTGQYKLNGKILFFEAVGDGDFEIKTDNVLFSIVIKTKTIEKNGKKYWKITGFDYTYDLIKKVYFKLDNLFGGDKEKAKPFTQMLDQNWKEVVIELGGPVFDSIVAKYMEFTKKFFLAIPADELEIA